MPKMCQKKCKKKKENEGFRGGTHRGVKAFFACPDLRRAAHATRAHTGSCSGSFGDGIDGSLPRAFSSAIGSHSSRRWGRARQKVI